MEYRHKEAFALMWYQCDKCDHLERFWNSRDGVTPFGGVSCPSCGSKGLLGGLQHILFHLDEHAPDHKPHPGQRVWRDGTDEEAREILRRRFGELEKMGHPVPDNVKEGMLAGVGQFSSEFNPGWPMWERTAEITYKKEEA